LARPLTIVAGKGGVGKTTVACAIAIDSADRGHRTLLVSTDPAPSIADALGQTIGDDAVPVDGASGLMARQMDATAAFVRFRAEYQDRVDALFSGLVAHGMDATHDRTVLRDLLTLGPPGIDEVYALSVLGDALVDAAFDHIIVDPAPTGHLLRLLDMPAIALDWTHRLMRLMLKYKEVVALGESATELLGFAKRTRALATLLRDPARCAVIAVGLDEPLVRGESERLVAELATRGLAVSAFIWNRGTGTPDPLAIDGTIPQLRAPAAPVVGVTELRRWRAGWSRR
jgi:arsenite-transporting ATPase